MFYRKLAVEVVGVLVLGSLVVVQLPAGAALAVMASFVWFIWVLTRLVVRWTTPTANTTPSDPITRPSVLNVRYIPEEKLPVGTRPFPIEENHHTWGVRQDPLGSWRIANTTRVLLVVEGLFDMLVGSQVIAERNLHPEIVAVYTNGASGLPDAALVHRKSVKV